MASLGHNELRGFHEQTCQISKQYIHYAASWNTDVCGNFTYFYKLQYHIPLTQITENNVDAFFFYKSWYPSILLNWNFELKSVCLLKTQQPKVNNTTRGHNALTLQSYFTWISLAISLQSSRFVSNSTQESWLQIISFGRSVCIQQHVHFIIWMSLLAPFKHNFNTSQICRLIDVDEGVICS